MSWKEEEVDWDEVTVEQGVPPSALAAAKGQAKGLEPGMWSDCGGVRCPRNHPPIPGPLVSEGHQSGKQAATEGWRADTSRTASLRFLAPRGGRHVLNAQLRDAVH